MLRFDNKTDSNKLSGTYFCWTVLSVIVSSTQGDIIDRIYPGR